MAIQSKLAPIPMTCHHYVHPWTENCSIATAGLIIQAAQDSFRIYSAFYTLSLLSRRRIPNRNDLKRTILGCIQSTAFLTTSAFAYCFFLCLINRFMGSFNFFTFSYVPAFLASVCALLIERPSRRGLLSLYVSNVATETIYRMAMVRGIVPNIPNGQAIIFGISVACMAYYYRMGLNRNHDDSIFDVLKFIIGSSEGNDPNDNDPNDNANTDATIQTNENRENQLNDMPSYRQRIQRIIKQFQDCMNQIQFSVKHLSSKHKTCCHPYSCPHHIFGGGLKMFSIGLGIQTTLKCLFQARRIIANGPKFAYKMLLKRDTFKLAMFLGSFSFLYRSMACGMRHIFNKDDPRFGAIAAAVASISFLNYPDITIALYVMWKWLQITYNIGVDRKLLPKMPHFTFLLYCTSTAMLFHTATFEPLCLRESYWKFLHSLSGGRVAGMDRVCLDIYGLDTVNQLAEVLRRTKTDRIIRYAL